MKKSKEFKMLPTKDFMIFKSGDYPQGKFSEKDLQDIVDAYDPKEFPAKIIVGHTSDIKTDAPVFGYIGGLKKVGKELWATGVEMAEELVQAIKDKYFTDRSIELSLYEPQDKNSPAPGKWYLSALAILGAKPPQVKGMPKLAEAMYSHFDKFVTIKFEEARFDEIEQVKDMGVADTMKDMAEYCGNYLKKVEDALMSDADQETKRTRIGLASSDLANELYKCSDSHFNFMNKMDSMEEGGEVESETEEEMEMSEKKSWLAKMFEQVKSLTNKRMETAMDVKKEQEYQAKIVELDAKVTEFTEKEKQATAAKEKADKEAAEAALVATVKTFCDQAVKENKMTPAMRTTDEPIMVTLAKTNADALKAFQQKYSQPVIVPGEVNLGNNGEGNKEAKNVLEKAAKYVKDNPKEFNGLSDVDAINRAHFLYSRGDIKFV